MGWIEFNGIRSTTLGVLVEKMPTEPKGKTRYNERVVPGHFGSVFTNDGTMDNIEAEVVINCFANAQPRDIYKWLNGEGYLTTSDNPELRRYVRFFDAQENDRLRLGAIYDSVTASFIGDPFQTEIAETPLTFTNDVAQFNGRGDMPSEPLLQITGGGDAMVMLNGCTIRFDGLPIGTTVYIDCESKQAYTLDGTLAKAFEDVEIDNSDNVNRWATISNNGNTLNTMGVDQIVIYPRWRWY